MPFWTREDLDDRLSADKVTECLDDNNEGEPDPGPLKRLQRDSDSYVIAALQDAYRAELKALADDPLADVPNELIRLSLDAAEMFLAKRHREVIKHDWLELKKSLDGDLDRVRTAKRSLGHKPPDPAANHGGAVYPTPDPSNWKNIPVFHGGGGRFGIF